MFAENRRRFGRKRDHPAPLHPALIFDGDRLELGPGAVLARIARAHAGEPILVYEGGEARALARLSAAYRRPAAHGALAALDRAARDLAHDRKDLALIRLAQAGFAKFDDRMAAARRVEIADDFIDAGPEPYEIAKLFAQEQPSSREAVYKFFNPDEPRVPKGNGRASGEWTRDLFTPASWPWEKYKIVHDVPKDAVEVRRTDGSRIPDPKSPTGFLLAPRKANFAQIYQEGVAIAGDGSWRKWLELLGKFSHEAQYDFQRDPAQLLFYKQYIHVRNYGIGVFAAGAQMSRNEILRISQFHSNLLSSNPGSAEQQEWTRRGWDDANKGKWKKPR